MPEAPLRPCSGGCGLLVERGLCSFCKAKRGGNATDGRRSSTQRGYGARWQASSKAWLAKHPFCADPFGVHGDNAVPATEADHIVPHKGDMKLFWNFDTNIQGLCKSCHSRKTASEGGFGRNDH